jgi:hypothetical protein
MQGRKPQFSGAGFARGQKLPERHFSADQELLSAIISGTYVNF